MVWKMRLVSPYIRFRCCRKIFWRRCLLRSLNQMLLPRREGPDECFGGRGREMRIYDGGQPRDQKGVGLSYGAIVGCAAERVGINGHERGLRRRRMRFVFRPARRRAGK